MNRRDFCKRLSSVVIVGVVLNEVPNQYASGGVLPNIVRIESPYKLLGYSNMSLNDCAEVEYGQWVSFTSYKEVYAGVVRRFT